MIKGALFGGMPIIENPAMVMQVEDWSRVRSPSRAARRQRQGHRQNIDVRVVPRNDAVRINGSWHIHPETLKILKALINVK